MKWGEDIERLLGYIRETETRKNAVETEEYDLYRQSKERGRRACKEAEDKFDKLTESYREELRTKRRSLSDTIEAMRDAVNTLKVAEAKESLPYPEGTKLYCWAKRRGYREDWHIALTGVFEVFGKDSEYPANRRGWSRPSMGEFVVRLTNKNGKPLKDCDRYRPQTWYPAGVDMTQRACAVCGKIFAPEHKDAWFCGDDCRDTWSEQRGKDVLPNYEPGNHPAPTVSLAAML